MKKRLVSLVVAIVMLFSYSIVIPVQAEKVNLITNGDFTDGFSGWTNASNGAEYDGTISDNADYIHGDGRAITNKAETGGSGASTMRRFIAVEGGKTYNLSFYVYNTGS